VPQTGQSCARKNQTVAFAPGSAARRSIPARSFAEKFAAVPIATSAPANPNGNHSAKAGTASAIRPR